jgi:hypothetical protein
MLIMGRIDPYKMYDIVMNKFTWGSMNEEGVNLDYYSIRTLSVIRFRSLHTRLALGLLEVGDTAKAIEVLDHCMKIAPHHVLPYDRYIAGLTFPQSNGDLIHHEGIIEAYYKCGATEKAGTLLEEYFDILNQQMMYFDSLKQKHKNLLEQEFYETMEQIEELRVLLMNYKQNDKLLELGF